jgi:hypothetical protein
LGRTGPTGVRLRRVTNQQSFDASVHSYPFFSCAKIRDMQALTKINVDSENQSIVQ